MAKRNGVLKLCINKHAEIFYSKSGLQFYCQTAFQDLYPMKYLSILISLLSFSLSGFCQTTAMPKGQWVEIRSEFENGSIFKIDEKKHIRRNTPYLFLDFSIKDTVLVNNMAWSSLSPQRLPLVYTTTQTLVDFNPTFHLIYLIDTGSNNDLLIMKEQVSGGSNGGRKYFLPRRVFDSLSQTVKDSLNGSWPQDDLMYESLVKTDTIYFKKGTEVVPQSPLDEYRFGRHFEKSKNSDYIKAKLQSENIAYPDTMKINFVVELTGKLSHISISDNNDQHLLAAITQILNEIGRWLPAKQNGSFVRSLYSIKITK